MFNVKRIAALTAVAAVAVPVVGTTVAQASTGSVTATVQRQWTRQVSNNARLQGISAWGFHVNCLPAGSGVYNCYGTFRASQGSLSGKYGIAIVDTPSGWHTRGTARYLG